MHRAKPKKIVNQVNLRFMVLFEVKNCHRLPFIPMQSQIDQLIAVCRKKTATFLDVLKETAMRSDEANRLNGLRSTPLEEP